MIHPLLDMRGVWEEIAPKLNAMQGQRIRVIIRQDEEVSDPSGEVSTPLDIVLREIWNEVPDTSWNKLPSDFADHIDYYLHGTSKRA